MVKMEHRQRNLIVYLDGELTFFNSSEIKEKIKKRITDEEERLVLEVSALEMIDSSGVGVFISLLKRMAGKDVFIVAPQPKIKRVFEITRLDQIIPILSTLEQVYQT